MRRLAIGAALAATLLACYFAPDDEGGVVAPASARTHGIPAPLVAEPTPTPALDIHPRLAEEDLGNAFARQSWQPETSKKALMAQAGAAQVAQGQPPPANQGPPPLPIRVLGRYVDEGKVSWFLQVGERNVVARVGDQVDQNYIFDNASGDTLTFTYLPLRQKQTLAAGDTN